MNHFERASKWDASRMQTLERSERRAWIVVYLLSLIVGSLAAVIFFMPPKVVMEPYVVRVDEATGAVEQATALVDMELTSEDAMTRHWLREYVIQRESYNYYSQQADYNTTIARSAIDVARDYSKWAVELSERYGDNMVVDVDIISIVPQNDWTATVRFIKRAKSKNKQREMTAWTATITYQYRETKKLNVDERDANPFGFQVTSYRLVQESEL